MKDKMRVGVVSLGCPRNLVDTEALLGRLKFKDYSIVDIQQAEVAIVNTCSFIEDAKQEAIKTILDLAELKREGRLKKLIVYGCLVQRYGNILTREIPEVDAYIGTPSLNHTRERFSLTPSHYAYLKICEGCVNQCSYCIIPKIKGPLKSLDTEGVLERVKSLDREGISELNIIGQDISGWGLDLYKRRSLPDLLKKILAATKNISWIRLLYLYPEDIIDSLLDLMRQDERILKYIDLPLQHINSRILKLMNRKTKTNEILGLIERIRTRVSDAAIRTSIIVGFPGETDKEFNQLLKFIRDVKFERLGAFIYSREEGTPAHDFGGQIPQPIKEERFNAVMSAQQEISREVNSKFLGRSIDVLIEAREDQEDLNRRDDVYLGRTCFDAPEVDGLVFVNSAEKLEPGEIRKVKITDTMEYDLVGEVEG